jgi:hypothetical protein
MATMHAKMQQGGMDWNACRSIEGGVLNQSTGKRPMKTVCFASINYTGQKSSRVS